MAKLRDLITTSARLLGETEASINVLAIQLRRAGLIRKEGRGLHAADMRADDAAALLTSALSGGLATEAAETTARVLKCENMVRPSRISHPASDEHLYTTTQEYLHPWIKNFDRPHTFGEAFSGLLYAYIHNQIQEPEQSYLWTTVSIERTAAFYECKIIIASSGGVDRLTYWGPTAKAESLPRLEVTAFRNDLLSRYGRKSTTEEIDHIVLSEIANLLRGDAQ